VHTRCVALLPPYQYRLLKFPRRSAIRRTPSRLPVILSRSTTLRKLNEYATNFANIDWQLLLVKTYFNSTPPCGTPGRH
jgi:hypothetical protein